MCVTTTAAAAAAVVAADITSNAVTSALSTPQPQARFPSKRNRLRCVRCVRMETGLNKRKVLAFSPVSIQTQRTQRTQRKRLRLDGNRASAVASIAVVCTRFNGATIVDKLIT